MATITGSAGRPAPTEAGRNVPPFLHPFAKANRTDFLNIVAGEGAHVIDEDGRRYIDVMASLWYCNVGHGREEIARAVAEQMQRLEAFHTFERFTNPAAEALCTELVGMAPFPGGRVFLASGGSEAVESALKLVRLAHAAAGEPRRKVIISRRPSYHGVTYGAMTATGLPANQEHFGPLVPEIIQVDKDDLDAVAELMTSRPGEVAAVIAEPVVGAGGVYPPQPGYLEGLRSLCDEHGAWLILDEVICGFGRLGPWWGAQHYGVRPDLVTFAKGATSGYQPLGGVILGPAVLRPLEAAEDLVIRHGYTYSGHPTACAAALKVLEIMRRESLRERVPEIGERLRRGLDAIAADGLVAEVRGAGAVWAVGMRPDQDAMVVRDRMLAGGVIPRPIGAATLAFCPPLVITADDIDRSLEVLTAALRQ